MDGLNSKNEVLIIYPNDLGTVNVNNMLYCEKFIDVIMNSNNEYIRLKINTVDNCVESNNVNVKKYVNLLQKAKQLYSFYGTFIKLLHTSDTDSSTKILKCVRNNKRVNVIVNELKPAPEFEWRIIARRE